MKKYIFTAFAFFFALTGFVSAHGMMGGYGGALNEEELAGKAVWEKLQTRQVTCAQLSDEDFELLGEYYMGTMMGVSHDEMNAYLKRQIGEEGEERAHAVMGKRMSGCDVNAAYPAGTDGFFPTMHDSFFGGYGPWGGGMMGYGPGYGFTHVGWFGGFFMILVWALIVVGFIAIIKWLMRETGSKDKNQK